MIKLIASDLDGTLLSEQRTFPDGFFELILELKKRGISFVAASGRSLYTLLKNFAPVIDDIGYICDNGAVMYDGGKYLFERPLSKETISAVCKRINGLKGVCPLLCGKKATYRLYGSHDCDEHINAYYINQQFVEDFSSVDDDIFKIAICDKSMPANNTFPAVKGLNLKSAEMQISGEFWMDVMASGVNKGEALRALQKNMNINSDETMAFGDFYNDIELLKSAKYSFVMENANEDMKKHGNYIAESNNSGGVMKAIVKHVINGEPFPKTV